MKYKKQYIGSCDCGQINIKYHSKKNSDLIDLYCKCCKKKYLLEVKKDIK